MGRHSTKDLLYKFINRRIVTGFWKFEKVIDIHGCGIEGLRCDAVCYRGNRIIAIVEAKKVLDLKALGQLLGYRELLSMLEGYNKQDIRLFVVCYEAHPLLVKVFEEFGVQVVQVSRSS